MTWFRILSIAIPLGVMWWSSVMMAWYYGIARGIRMARENREAAAHSRGM